MIDDILPLIQDVAKKYGEAWQAEDPISETHWNHLASLALIIGQRLNKTN